MIFLIVLLFLLLFFILLLLLLLLCCLVIFYNCNLFNRFVKLFRFCVTCPWEGRGGWGECRTFCTLSVLYRFTFLLTLLLSCKVPLTNGEVVLLIVLLLLILLVLLVLTRCSWLLIINYYWLSCAGTEVNCKLCVCGALVFN